MKKNLFLSLSLLLVWNICFSQTYIGSREELRTRSPNRILIRVGTSIYDDISHIENNEDLFKLDNLNLNNRISSSMIGLRTGFGRKSHKFSSSGRDKNRGNVYGLYYKTGVLSENSRENLNVIDKRYNELQIGYIWREFLKISYGKGSYQSSNIFENIVKNNDYSVLSSGINLRFGRLTTDFNMSLITNDNFKTVYNRLEVGVGLNFYLFKRILKNERDLIVKYELDNIEEEEVPSSDNKIDIEDKNIKIKNEILIPLKIYNFTRYSKNSHVSIKTTLVNQETYKIKYTFKDHFNNLHTMQIFYDKDGIDIENLVLGVPKSMYEPYTVTPLSEIYRKKIIRDGLYVNQGNILRADCNRVVNYYRRYVKKTANDLLKYLKENNLNTRDNKINIAMKFVQDIPYGIPNELNPHKYDDGIFTPTEILINGYGDCDSKTFLFVGLLSYMINPNDILFVDGDNHFFSAIKDYGNSSGTYFNHEGSRYYICETAGPGRPDYREGLTVGKYHLIEYKLR